MMAFFSETTRVGGPDGGGDIAADADGGGQRGLPAVPDAHLPDAHLADAPVASRRAPRPSRTGAHQPF